MPSLVKSDNSRSSGDHPRAQILVRHYMMTAALKARQLAEVGRRRRVWSITCVTVAELRRDAARYEKWNSPIRARSDAVVASQPTLLDGALRPGDRASVTPTTCASKIQIAQWVHHTPGARSVPMASASPRIPVCDCAALHLVDAESIVSNVR